MAKIIHHVRFFVGPKLRQSVVREFFVSSVMFKAFAWIQNPFTHIKWLLMAVNWGKMGFSTRLCVWAWLPHNKVAGFPQQMSQESQTKHSAFYDLALKITWCHFHHILSGHKSHKVSESGNWDPTTQKQSGWNIYWCDHLWKIQCATMGNSSPAKFNMESFMNRVCTFYLNCSEEWTTMMVSF